MIKRYLPLVVLMFFVACTGNDKFTVEGEISNGSDKTVYFEKHGLVGDSLIDSLKLNDAGHIKFKVRRADYPDLYRLRVGNQQLILGIDSTESIHIQADANNLIDAKIEGSRQSEEIQQLRKSLRSLQSLLSQISDKNSPDENNRLRDSLINNLEEHKQTVRGFILTNQLSLSSYYGLFQQLGGVYIFTPYRKDDLPYFQSVATGFNTFMPEYERSKNLYQLVIGALSEKRKAKKISEMDFKEIAKETGFIDLALKDKNGYPKKISDLLGNVILIDFVSYESENKIAHTFDLRKLYDTYSDQDLKIYQVGAGENKGIWMQSVSALPWICVWDESGKGVQNYNVQKVPTLFLINREGSIIGRFSSVDEVSKAVANQF